MIVLHRDVIRLISVVYFLQGATGIAAIALPLYLRQCGFSVKEIAYYNSIVAIPWFLKILYGAISDAFPIFGYRRKPYIIICGIFSCLGWLLMALCPPKMHFLIFAMSIANFGFAVTDVVTDGIVVEHSVESTSQIYQGFSWGSRSVGAAMSGILGGYLAYRFDYRIVFLMTAMLPIIFIVMVYFYRERKVIKPNRPNIFMPLIESFKKVLTGDLRWFCVLLLIISLSSSFATPLFFYMKETLRFSETLLGFLSSIGWLGAAIGCILYMNLFKKMHLKKALKLAVTVGFFEILFCLLIQDRSTAIMVFLLAGILGYFILLPLMSSAARLAHGSGVESSLFAILMGIFNLGQAGSTFVGGWLFERVGIEFLIIGTACLTLLGFLFIPKLKMIH